MLSIFKPKSRPKPTFSKSPAIQSSVYPEGYGTQEHFNSMWQHAHNEVFKMYREQNLEEKKLQLN
jgi:AraC-like DNA-binding protein